MRWTKDTIWRHISIRFLDHFRLTKLSCHYQPLLIYLFIYIPIHVVWLAHMYSSKHTYQKYSHTFMHTFTQIYSPTNLYWEVLFISMRITNLTTVALNLHVNDDYFGCFRLFLQIRAFISFQSRFVVYHICMGLSKMCPILFIS